MTKRNRIIPVCASNIATGPVSTTEKPEPIAYQLPDFYNGYLLRGYACFLLGVAVLILNWWIFRTVDATFIFFLLCAIPIALLTQGVQSHALKNIRCPDCQKEKLPRWKPRSVEGAPIQVYCETCHVVWDTGLEYHDYSEGYPGKQ